MKKFNLLLLLASLFAVGGAKAQAYQESDLTDAGWTEVTSLEQNNAVVSQYVYVFYSVEGENLMLAQGIVTGYHENLPTGVYRTAANPFDNPLMVWMIDYSEGYEYGLRNLSNPVPYMQSRNDEGFGNPGPWTIQFNAAWSSVQNQWTRFNLAYSGNSWTIENNAANDDVDSKPYKDIFIGPWDENASSFSNGKAVAGNKTGDYVGHFKLYRMKKSVYYGKKYYPEFTAVTSTADLTADKMAANYYIVVAETNPDLAVTARNKEDADVRLKYVTQSVFTNAAQIWTLQANDGGYSFRNLKKDHALLQAHTEAWGTNIADEQTAVARTKFELTSDGNTGFTILNSSFPNNYLGLWHPTHGYRSEELMAANKSGNNIAHFYIYSISRSNYKTQFLDKNSEVTDLFMTNPHVENTHGWEGINKKTFDKESFTGAPDNICLDLNNSGNIYQFVTLPKGDYLLKVATRGISNANAGIYVKVKGASVGDDLVNVQVQKKDNTGNELGNGWGWTYLSFSIAEEKELEIGFFVVSGAYAGADDFHLYNNNNVVTMNETSTSVDLPAGKHANVFMNRNITRGKWATLCLPFAMAKPNDWEVRELSSVTESDGVYTLNFTEATSLVAGKPYMVKTTEDVTRIVATDVEVLTEPVNQTVSGVTMKGVFTSGNVPEGQYFVSGNKFYRAADESNTLKAFRAYFEINDSPEARSLILNIDETTSVTTLDGQQSATAQPEAVFDLSGRRQTRLMPGINIVRQADGTVKKVFVK